MVDDLERPAQLAVLRADRVEAVRAGGDDRPLLHAVPLQRLDVGGREHLEDVLVAHPARRIARCRTPPGRGSRSGPRRPGGRWPRPGRPSGCARRTQPRSRPSTAPRASRACRPGPGPPTVGTGNGRSFVQSARPARGLPHGLPACSMLRKAPVSSAGKRDSSRTRLRRRPTILSTCSMRTGQASTQAPQVTQSQTAS